MTQGMQRGSDTSEKPRRMHFLSKKSKGKVRLIYISVDLRLILKFILNNYYLFNNVKWFQLALDRIQSWAPEELVLKLFGKLLTKEVSTALSRSTLTR
jgi:hypothetical protein